MKMKFRVALAAGLLAFGSVGASAQSRADEAAKLGEARAIIAIMQPAGERERLLEKLQGDVLTQLQSTIPPVMASDAGMKVIIGNFISDGMARQRPVILKHLPAISEAMAGAYTREFSLAELKTIHAFALTPVGSHYFSKFTAIAADPAVSQANLAMMTELRTATQANMPAFKRKVLAYLIEHPELAERIAAAAKTAK